MRIWLTFALLTGLAGCAGDHMLAPGGDAGNDAGWHSNPATGDAGSPAMCHDVAITSAHVPRAVPEGTLVPVHLASNTMSSTACGCDTHATTAGSGEISLAACDCCLDCDRIDFGYEATTSMVATTSGPSMTPRGLSIAVAGALVPLETTIVDPTRCVGSGAVVTEITPIAPDGRLRQGTPSGAWVELHAFDRRCCGEPLELVTATITGTMIDLSLAECAPDPCDCAPDRMADASTPVYLGVLAPGTYTVHANDLSTTITVP